LQLVKPKFFKANIVGSIQVIYAHYSVPFTQQDLPNP